MSNRRKKVLFYYMRGGTAGGSDTCLFLLLKYLDQEKFEPYLMYDEKSNFAEELKEIGIKIIPISKFLKANQKQQTRINRNAKKTSNQKVSKSRLFLGSLKKTIKRIPESIRYANIIKKYGIDIVHTNHHLTGYDRTMILASIFMRKPVISHNRGLYKPDQVDQYISKYVDKMICMSDFSKSVYTDNGIPNEKCQTIYDGIEVDQCNPSNIESEIITIGCFGRLEEWKGQQILIEAVEIIVKTVPEIKIFIVGNGPSEGKLQEQVKNRGLEKHIEFTGHITNVNDYMNRCSIIAHTSIEPEPFGMVITEAMALGKPVIATNFGGPLEIIDNGKDGILIPPKNPSILAESILSLIENPSLRIQIGKNARQKVIFKFDVKDYARHIEQVYEQV
ncbi:MAG: glycosyltransferase family 4 protein [Ignavibacteriae bacterium]|nr:glycosyltransferase family 4 protein [Ignavibacteriota bacterium]